MFVETIAIPAATAAPDDAGSAPFGALRGDPGTACRRRSGFGCDPGASPVAAPVDRADVVPADRPPAGELDWLVTAQGSPAAVQALVVQAQAGDSAAFAQLYNLYARRIHAYLRLHLNGRIDLADDLAADVFLKALEKLSSYQFSGIPFSAWLYRIAHNHLVDHLRRHAKRRGVSLDACRSVHDPAAAHALDEALAQRQLADALSTLTEDQRQTIVYRFRHDRSIVDTARLRGKQEDAIKQLQVRGLRNLRRALAVA